MLKKLLKYDLKWIFKLLVVFYSIALVFAILTRMFLYVDNSTVLSIIGKICSGVTISFIFNMIVNNIIRCWARFVRNLYGDESYLTHTLPIEKKTIFLSKFLTGIITMLVSIVVILVVLFIAYYSKENIELVKNLLLPLATVYNSTVITIILAFIFICFLEIMNMLQSGYTGIILGHRKNNNKMGYSVLFGIGTYLFTQIVAISIMFIVALFNKDLMNLFYTVESLNVSTIKMLIYFASGIYLLNILILYFINSKLFIKGVNVD